MSLSHSGSRLAFAVAQMAIGCDVERVKPRPFDAIAAAFFRAEEADELARTADQQTLFYRLWTAKEAVAKALGLTLAEGLRRVGISPPIEDWRQPPALRADTFWLFGRGDERYAVALAIPRASLKLPDVDICLADIVGNDEVSIGERMPLSPSRGWTLSLAIVEG